VRKVGWKAEQASWKMGGAAEKGCWRWREGGEMPDDDDAGEVAGKGCPWVNEGRREMRREP